MSHSNLRRRKQGSLAHLGHNGTNNDLKLTNAADQALINASLTDRLQELLVFELHKDGSRQYMRLTVRGLYRYVLSAITDRGGFLSSTRNLNALQASTTDAFNNSSNEAPSTTIATTLISTALPAMVFEQKGPLNDKVVTTADVYEQPLPHPPPTMASLLRNSPVKINMPQRSQNRASTTSEGQNGFDEQPAAEPVVYRERLGEYLHPRDMRRLVMPFSTTNEPDVIVRRHVMLLNFDPLRAIILRDRVLVLVPDGADSLLLNLEHRVRGVSAEMENSIFGGGNLPEDGGSEHSRDGDTKKIFSRTGSDKALTIAIAAESHEEQTLAELSGGADANQDVATGPESDEDGPQDVRNEMEAHEGVKLPFELQCADAVLHVVGSILAEDTFALQTAAQKYTQGLHHDHGLSDDPLTIIRHVKDAVQLMMNRIKGFIKSMNRILDDDEDMALMNLSRFLTHPERFIQPVPQQVLEEESDEPELILEGHLQIALTLMNHLDLVKGQVNTAKEFIDQKQDAMRNRLLFAELMFSVFSLLTYLVMSVGLFFGMNVHPNGIEEKEGAFARVVGGTVAAAVFTCFFILAVLLFSGMIPRRFRTVRTRIEL